MSEKWLENIKRNDAATLAEKFFPGRIFGEKTEQVAELCRIAEKISFSDNEMIQKFVTSYFGDDTFFLNDETIASDGRRIIGKKYISDGHSKNGTCNQCREYAGRVFKWPEEKEKMPVVPRHPNCKCHYENVYENTLMKVYNALSLASKGKIDSRYTEKLVSAISKANVSMRPYTHNLKDEYLYFNGRFLFSSTGHLILDAVSGKPIQSIAGVKVIFAKAGILEHTNKITFDYSKARQKIQNVGGLPEGIYCMMRKESGSLANGNVIKHMIKQHLWGRYHWRLIPLPKTNTYERKRNSFTIHGGSDFGSGGCIDLQKNDVILYHYLKNLKQEVIYIYVKYDEELVSICVNSISAQTW